MLSITDISLYYVKIQPPISSQVPFKWFNERWNTLKPLQGNYIISYLNWRRDFTISFNRTALSVKDDVQIFVEEEDRK